MKKIKTTVDVFNITTQKHLGNFKVSEINLHCDNWRAKGYGVCIDIDGDVCIDEEDSDDDGLYYSEQFKTL